MIRRREVYLSYRWGAADADGGSVRFSFNNATSVRVPWNANANALKVALSDINELTAVSVLMDASGQMCTLGGSNTTVTIVHPQVKLGRMGLLCRTSYALESLFDRLLWQPRLCS